MPVVMIAVVLALCLTLVLAVVRADPPERSQPLQISTSEWLPYISPDLPNNGPVAEMLTEVLGRAGYTPVFTFSTWPLAERDVTNGASIGMAPVIVSASRDSFALYTEPLLDFRYTLIGKKGELLDSVADLTDLDGLRIARVEGYQYWDELDDSGATFSDHPSSLDAFTAMMNGEADLVAEGAIAGRAVLEGPSFLDDATAYAEVSPSSSLTSSTQGLHLLLKDSSVGQRLKREIDAALADFQRTEDYQRLLDSLTPGPPQVTLSTAQGGAVELMDDSGAFVGATPSGTSASVLEWPDGTPTAQTLVPVKILDGPLAGKLLAVRLEDLEISDA